MPAAPRINGPSLALVAPVDLTEACLATPAFRAIRRARPDLTPVILCSKSSVPLWKTYFQQVLSYDESATPQQLADRFATGTYHSALLLEDSRAARALTRLGVPQRLGFDTPELAKLLTETVTLPPMHGPLPHRVSRYLQLAEQLQCNPHQAENFAPPPLPKRPSVPRIALAPDSDLGPAAEWPVESFVELTQALASTIKPKFYLLSLPGKCPAADRLAAALCSKTDNPRPSRPISQSEPRTDCDLAELLEILPTFSALVGCDSSLIQLAAHLGLPTVTLMGPQSPEQHRPLGKIHRVLSTYAECSPCHLRKCPLDHRCLRELSVATVAKAVQQVLA